MLALGLCMSLALGGLAGCGKKEESKTETKADSDSGSKAEVNIALTTDPDNLDASRADDTAKNAVILEVQETLVRFDENGELQPAGAESWDVS